MNSRTPSLNLELEEIDEAMRVYLGGPLNEGGIQIGCKVERLAKRFPKTHRELKIVLDLILDSAVDWAKNKSDDNHDTIDCWLAKQLHSISEITREKISNYVIYQIEH